MIYAADELFGSLILFAKIPITTEAGMTRKDGLLALLVVVVWGLNFVVIKVGLHNMPPLMLAGLRFCWWLSRRCSSSRGQKFR